MVEPIVSMDEDLIIENDSILKEMDSLDNNKKIITISKLSQITDKKIITKMISLLDDDDITIRGEVFSALYLNENDISEILINSLDETSKNIRAFCSLILANRNDKNSIKSIIRLTSDSNSIVRSCAFGALGHLRAKNASNEIRQGIFDSDVEVKKSAAHALILVNEEFSDAEIIELEKQQDSEFRKILKKIIKWWTGRDLNP